MWPHNPMVVSFPRIAIACWECNISRIKSAARSPTRATAWRRRPKRSARLSARTTCPVRASPNGSFASPMNWRGSRNAIFPRSNRVSPPHAELGALPLRSGQEQVVPDFLKKAERHQREIEDGLTNLLDLLAVWGGASEIRGEARVLRDLLNRLASETDRFGERIPSGRSARCCAPNSGPSPIAPAPESNRSRSRRARFSRAGRLAEQKERASMVLNGLSAATDIAGGAMAAAANALPMGELHQSAANANAAALCASAEDLRGLASADQEEAAALRKGVRDAGGDSLPIELRNAANDLRNNHQGEGANLQRSAAERLDRLATALAEKPRDEAPDLKKLRKSADELDALAGAQDDLRKRGAEAARMNDPAKRAAELRRLAVEQDKLMERGRELLQRLTREGADGPAFETRHALDRMETARDQLEQGNSATRAQNDVVDRLDSARDRLDRATADPTEKLSDEKRATWPMPSRACLNGRNPQSLRRNAFTSSLFSTRPGGDRSKRVTSNSRGTKRTWLMRS